MTDASDGSGKAPAKKNRRGEVPDAEKCAGRSRQTGLPCKRRRTPGSEYCSNHGGKHRKGIAHPGFKHGGYSKVMPPVHLREKWAALRDDPELLEHKNNVALVDSMVQDVFDHYEAGGTPALWRRLWEAWGRLEVANRAKDPRKAREFYEELGLVIERGMRQSGREHDVVVLLEARRKHADSQLRREIATREVFTYEEAAAFYVALGAAVRRHCTKEQILAIDRDLGAIAAKRDVSNRETGSPGTVEDGR